jgi:transcriptional regulator with XRE-family HTH domain
MKPVRNAALAHLLISRRLELGLTQKEVAEKAGIKFFNFYGRMEREGFIPRQRHKIIKLADALKIDASVLINTTDPIASQIDAVKFLEPILASLLPGKSLEDINFILTVQKLFLKPLPPELIEELLKYRK